MAGESESSSRERIVLSTGTRLVVLAIADIVWIKADGHQVVVHTVARSEVFRVGLKTLCQQLPKREFVRIHRSILIHRRHVLEIRPKSHGDSALLLTSGPILTLSRTRRAEVLPRIFAAGQLRKVD